MIRRECFAWKLSAPLIVCLLTMLALPAQERPATRAGAAGGVVDATGERARDGAARRPSRSGDLRRGARTKRRTGADRRTTGLDARTLAAVERGLSYLARTQNPNGSWTDLVGRKVYTSYSGRERDHVGVTALCGMAFLSSGVVPSGGPGVYKDRSDRRVYGHEIVEHALDFVIAKTGPSGFVSAHGSRMYSHAFASLFLAEAYGMGYSRGGKLQAALRRAIAMIEESQNDEGGWRYRPQSEDSDMSITVCQVVALRAARNAGVRVSRDVIDAAVDYVQRSFIQGVGAFTYQLSSFGGVQSRDSFALTAAGLTTLYGAGEYAETGMIRQSVRYLWLRRPHHTEARHQFDYYYGQYYAVQAMFQKGGEDWRRWYEEYIKPDLLRLQSSKDGSWRDLVGARYATAMATIILQFPNQYLPITEN